MGAEKRVSWAVSWDELLLSEQLGLILRPERTNVTLCSWKCGTMNTKSQMFKSWIKYQNLIWDTLLDRSYVLGGEELHPLGHLVAEAQEIVVGQDGRVADDQVQPAASCVTRWDRRQKKRRRGEEQLMNGHSVLLLGDGEGIRLSCDFMG